MEPATYRDIWKNFLSNHKHAVIAARLRNMAGTFIADNNSIPKPEAMIGDLFFAAAICRVLYFRVPAPLPATNDVEAMANYHKRYYNTATGKAVANENISRFYQAIKA